MAESVFSKNLLTKVLSEIYLAFTDVSPFFHKLTPISVDIEPCGSNFVSSFWITSKKNSISGSLHLSCHCFSF